jgi:hypothetical protein
MTGEFLSAAHAGIHRRTDRYLCSARVTTADDPQSASEKRIVIPKSIDASTIRGRFGMMSGRETSESRTFLEAGRESVLGGESDALAFFFSIATVQFVESTRRRNTTHTRC